MTVEQAIELLKRLIATPSVSRDESAAADIVEAQMVEMGFKPQRKGNNVWAEAWGHDESKPTILLDAHIDTVRPNAQWVRNPFTPTVEGDRLYGLGSNDTGGSLVAMMTVFSQLAATEQPYNLIMLASAEEEVTGVNGVRAVLPELGKVDFTIVGEPTGMNPAVAELSHGWIHSRRLANNSKIYFTKLWQDGSYAIYARNLLLGRGEHNQVIRLLRCGKLRKYSHHSHQTTARIVTTQAIQPIPLHRRSKGVTHPLRIGPHGIDMGIEQNRRLRLIVPPRLSPHIITLTLRLETHFYHLSLHNIGRSRLIAAHRRSSN